MSAPIRPFADQGNYVGIHNAVFDHLMPRLSDSAFKVLCVVIRRTKGFDKKSDHIPYGAFIDGTGIKSEATISKALKELVGAGIILKKSRDTRFGSVQYALNHRFQIDPSQAVPTTSNFEVDESGTSKNEAQSGTSKSETSKFEVGSGTLKNEAATLQNLKSYIKTKSTTFTNVQVVPPTTENELPKKEPKKNGREPPYSWGSVVPLDEPLHAALAVACHVKASSTEKKKRAVEELARDFIAEGRAVSEIEAAVANYWDHKFKRAYFGEGPTPEVLRDHIDEILRLSEVKNDRTNTSRTSSSERAADKLRDHRASLQRRALALSGGDGAVEDSEPLPVGASGGGFVAGANGR